MNTLNRDWITEGAIDFEYKKYVLLAYLQHCHGYFEKKALYPPLSDLVEHYKNLVDLNQQIELMKKNFPKNLKGIDSENAGLVYEQVFEENEYFSTVTDIVDYAIPNMKELIEEGKNVYEKVEQQIEFIPLGVLPVYKDEGYVLIQPDLGEEVTIYNYRLSAIGTGGENFRALEFSYISSERRSIVNTYENIKIGLIRNFRHLPNPATYLCRFNHFLPLKETLLPVSRRMLMREILGV